MIYRPNANPYREDTYDKGRHFEDEELFHCSEKSSSHSSSHNRSNKYTEEYSFNKNDCISNKSSTSQAREQVPEVYQPPTLRQEESSSDRNAALMNKYSTIYYKLLQLENMDVIFLFLEEIEENEKCRLKMTEEERHLLALQEETKELKAILEKKRQAICRLCETQSYNLNLIECMQLSSKQINWDSHYLVKYQQLQKYMNEYISSTNEAQEEFARSFKILKMENKKVVEANQQLQKENLECSRQLQLVQMRHSKCIETWNGLKERESAMMASMQRLKDDNANLKQEMQELNKSIRANEQFQIVLSKENKQLSSQLDFIRQKLGDNSSLSRDIFEKSDSDLYNKLAKEKEDLQVQLSHTRKDYDQIVREKNELGDHCSKLITQLEEKQAIIEELQRQAKTTVKPLCESSAYKLKNASNRSLESSREVDKSSLPTLPRNCKQAYKYETLF